MITRYPKVLIVGRIAWNAGHSTLSSIFEDYPADKLAYICIETQEPDFSQCANHFQISEIALIKKLFKWSSKTGHRREPSATTYEEKSLEQSEASTMGWVRRHRSSLFLYMREVLWRLRGWKTKELDGFITGFAPDVLFFLGDPLPLMCRLESYILHKTKLPAAIFMMDDIWSYESDSSFLRYLLRREVKRLIPACTTHFAISPKMKEEYDRVFGINCILLTKGIAESAKPLKQVHSPIRLVYTGNLNYGRLYSLAAISKTIEKINNACPNRVLLNIYTQTDLSEEERAMLDKPGISNLLKPVPYSELPKIYEQSDIVLFVESLQKRYQHVARLSFSTKLTDYLACGRCIFAVGANDIAPIEYLRNAEIAITCGSVEEIEERLYELLNDTEHIVSLASKSLEYGMKHHHSQLMHERLQAAICHLATLH